MNDTEQDLTDLMRRATEGLQADSVDMVGRAMRRGRQLRRRRNAGIGLGAAAVVALSAGTVLTVGAIGQDKTDVQAATTPAAPAPVASAKAPKSDTLAALQKLVPARAKISEPDDWSRRQFTAASVTVDDGKGLSELNVSIQRQQMAAGDCPASVGGWSCTVLSDGSRLISIAEEVTNGRGAPEKFPHGRPDQGVKDNRVELHRRDGVVISITNYNARDEKGSPNTRALPPFSVAELTAMVRSPLWQDIAVPR